MYGFVITLFFFGQIALGADCPREFAKVKPLQITYQAPLLLAAPPPKEVGTIWQITEYLRSSGRAAMVKKVERWVSREETEVGEAILLAAQSGRWDELIHALEKTGPNLRQKLFELRAEISEQIAKNAKPFVYDLDAVRTSRPGTARPPNTFRYGADEVTTVMERYPALARNISERSASLANLKLKDQAENFLDIPEMNSLEEAKLARLSEKEKKMMVAVWNRMNDPKAAARYVKELAEDAAVEMVKSGSQRAEDALLRGELIRNDVLKVLVKRHKARGNDKFSVIVDRSANSKPSTPTRKTGSNDDFREAVRQGPFFDKPFLGSRHGVDTHYLQIEYVDDVIWEASGGNPREFWEFLGSKRGISYWVTLFDSFSSETLSRPEYFAHQISGLLKITD